MGGGESGRVGWEGVGIGRRSEMGGGESGNRGGVRWEGERVGTEEEEWGGRGREWG